MYRLSQIVVLITFSRDKGLGVVNIGQKVLEQKTIVGRLEKNTRFI